jgi:hypothetical protein
VNSQPYLALDAAIWILVRDGNRTGLDLFLRHYSATRGERRKIGQFVGPGGKMVLLTADARALFVWRRAEYRTDGQIGIDCAVFRNEGTAAGRSSDLIREACALAWERWPHERLFTFVDAAKVRRKRDPGRCFLRAGFRLCGKTQTGKLILELKP